MKQLVTVLVDEIVKHIVMHQSNVIRIEGIDTPLIYQSICQKMDSFIKVDQFIPKITREKYNLFEATGKEEWVNALAYLQQGRNSIYKSEITADYAEQSFVDFNNAITKWRNESANNDSQKTTLILLMGTEAAQDKGGLADTSFVISPKEIITNLSKNYSVWFAHIIENNNIHEEYQKAIHTLYKTLFSQVSTDIFALSDFIDSLEPLNFSSVQELIAHICETLNCTWKIPSIIDKKAVPKVSALNKGTMNSAKIITNAIKFIDRSEDIPTDAALTKLHQKFLKYAEDQNIEVSSGFPEMDPLFIDYNEFEKTVREFMQGIDLESNRAKLLKVDFAIIDAIIGTKLPRTPKEKTPTYAGSPIEVYSKIFIDTTKNFHSSYGIYPTKIRIRVNKILLSDCTEEQEQESFEKVCNFVGGILNFFNELTIDIDGEILEFEYENDACDDPFNFLNYDFIKTKIRSTGKWGDPCKIQFGITAINDEKSHKYEYKWIFSPYAPWFNAFTYLTDVFDFKDSTYHILPTLVSCSNIQDYLDCESEDEFYAHLQQFRGVALYDEHKAAILRYFTGTIKQLFELVCDNFKNFVSQLTQNGLFNALKEMRILVKSYTDLMKAVHDMYPSFTDVQREKMSLLVNMFTISSNSDIVNNCDMGAVIVPAYNPIMLEKIDAQQLFLRRGFEEIMRNMMSGNYTDNVLNSKFDNLLQLSSITQAADTIRKKADEYLICKNMWEYFGVYYGKNNENDLLSNSAVGLSIVTDDEDAAVMLRNTPMSNIIVRNVMDYVRTFPARIDGLNIAFIAPTDMQHIVAAIHSIAKHLDSEECPATINIKIICVNSKKNSSTYLRRWLDSYFSDEKSVKVNTFLRNSTVQLKTDIEEIRSLLTNYDLCFTYNILQSTGIQFDLSADENIDMNYEKFPMTFTPDTIPASHGKARRVNISQFQFLAAKQHTQTSHIIGYPHSIDGIYRVYRSLELPEIQEAIIDIAHTCCKWVVCIDQAIDRHMLETTDSKIIGFTTGEGSYGELNVTVSARKDILVDIKQMLQRRITEKFTDWDNSRLQKATDYCVDELSQYMDGSRILKALNPYDYEIHSFLAYILTLQMLGLTKQNNDYIVRTLISLDSYKHWFEEDDEWNGDNKRPDFMLIEIPYSQHNITFGTKLKINAKIIECKMGFQNENHIAKAQEQLEKGLRTMAMNWRPDAKGVMHRYWLNQLYRAIIFSPLNIDNASDVYNLVRNKIYGILNGEYEIEWTGDIFAYWLDVNDEVPEEEEISLPVQRELAINGIALGKLECHNCGQMFIQKMLLPEEERNSSFSYNTMISPDEGDSCDQEKENGGSDTSEFDEADERIENAKNLGAVVINQFSIKKSNITRLDLDCIVNAANNHLLPGEGICGAIFREAGYDELAKACNEIGYCETGAAVITPAFHLKSKYIIHAVGPTWHGGYDNEAEQLQNCYNNALRIAVNNGCHSIAFPVISSDNFGYPKEQAWDIAIKTVYDFLAEHEEYGMVVIMSVLDDEAYNLGNRRLEKYLKDRNCESVKEKEIESIEPANEAMREQQSDGNDESSEDGSTRLEDIRVLIGKDKKNLPVYWEFGHAKLANRHILITGTSGQGKTYAIQTMILELARQNISSVVFDYTDGFLPGKLEPEFEAELEGKIKQEVAILNRIPVKPFRLQMIEIPPFGSVPEKSTTVAGRISDILKHVYSFGDQQTASIYAACKQGIDQYGTSMDFCKLRQLLEEMGTAQSKSVLSKMAQFFDMDLFDSSREFDWRDVTKNEGKVTVIQLTGLDRELQTIVTEIMMWDAWYSLTKFGNKNTPFVVVFDEAQNLSFKEKSPAEKILREGRKYGWSAWFATQFLKGALDSGEISNLQQAAERLYFKPTGEEINYIADQIADNKAEAAEWSNIIKCIEKGQCIVQGDRIRPNGQFGAVKPTLTRVSSFAER